MKIRKKFNSFPFAEREREVFSCFLPARLWPTIFHDSQNFVIIIDGYENVERIEGGGRRARILYGKNEGKVWKIDDFFAFLLLIFMI